MAYLLPLYLLALVGVTTRRNEPVVRLVGAVVAVHLGAVTVFFAEYDARWLAQTMGLIGLLAAVGADAAVRAAARRRRSAHPGRGVS